MGPVLEQEQSNGARGALPHLGLQYDATAAEQTSRLCEHQGRTVRPSQSRRSSNASDPRGTRTWPADRVGAAGAEKDWSGGAATMATGGGKLWAYVRYGVDTVRYVLYQLYQPSVQIQ